MVQHGSKRSLYGIGLVLGLLAPLQSAAAEEGSCAYNDDNVYDCSGSPSPDPDQPRQLQYGWEIWGDEYDGPCTVDRFDIANLSESHFNSVYRERKPVVITGLVGKNEHFRSLNSREALIRDWGHTEITMSTANTWSHDKYQASLTEYIAKHMGPQDPSIPGIETMYHFGDNNFTTWKAHFEQYKRPPYIPISAFVSLSFGLAGPLSGVPFHIHGAGYSEAIVGRKRWFISPPKQKPDFSPHRTTLQWLLDGSLDKALQTLPDFQMCTLETGDMIYFPSEWWHATLNLDQSVFISAFVDYGFLNPTEIDSAQQLHDTDEDTPRRYYYA